MIHTPPHSSRRPGFTLVELLVVIAIIAVLASLGFAMFNKTIENAKKTSARVCMGNLVQACDAFYEEYQALPMAGTSAIDAEQTTNNQFMAPLLGLQMAIAENPKRQAFFEFKTAKGKGAGAHDGIERTENRAELLGPWLNTQKNDRHYRLMLNYDYDDQLREPQNLGNEIIFERRVIVYHMGKDGKVGGKNNEDNVYSWNKSQ